MAEKKRLYGDYMLEDLNKARVEIDKAVQIIKELIESETTNPRDIHEEVLRMVFPLMNTKDALTRMKAIFDENSPRRRAAREREEKKRNE